MSNSKKRTPAKKTSAPPKKKQLISNQYFGRNRLTYMTLAGLVVAVIVAVASVHYYLTFQDKRRFHWAEQRLIYVQSQLDKVTGLKVDSQINKHCAPITEAPLDNSVDCTIELDATYKVTNQAEASNAQGAIQRVYESPQAFGGSLINPYITPSNTNFNVASKGLNCVSSFEAQQSNYGQIPSGQTTDVIFSASCFAPSENIYP